MEQKKKRALQTIQTLERSLKQIQEHQQTNIEKMKKLGKNEQSWYTKQNAYYFELEMRIV